MSDELCILFAYHKTDELTLTHYELLKQYNSHYSIIPIADNITEHVPGTIDVNIFEDPWQKANAWRRPDTMLYRWFLNREISAKRYLFLEYDVRCTVDVASAYAAIWEADVAARDFFLPGQGRDTRCGEYIQDEWANFREIERLPVADRRYAAGLVPLAGILFSHDGLNSIVKNAVRNDVFSELRIGTAAQKAGLKITEFPESLKRTIQWDPHVTIPKEPGIYHAIKSIH